MHSKTRTAVHVSGTGMLTSLGIGVDASFHALLENTAASSFVPEWADIEGLHSHIAAWVPDYDANQIPRTKRRTMSKMSEMLCLAADEALHEANLSTDDLRQQRVMMIVGSTTPSNLALAEAQKKFHESGNFKGILSTIVFKCMNHSVAMNLSSYWDFQGPVLSPSSACSTGAQAILMGKQMIESGYCDIAVVGGADEAHLTSCFCFDVAHAASRSFNDTPQEASRPFDQSRDGIVVSEGASVLILESDQSLENRAAASRGRILGGAQWCDGSHVSKPNVSAMKKTIEMAASDAGITPKDIGYVNAHATSTKLGDLLESQAVFECVGENTPISSVKGHMGHSFAASGSSEAIFSLKMLEKNKLIGTRNLCELDPAMPQLDYIMNNRNESIDIALSNSFAFGGMNVSLVLGK